MALSLPDLHAAWARALLAGAPLPVERRAECAACPMCAGEAPPGRGFAAESRCCTYVPALPNFLVGAILSARGPGALQAQAGVRARMADPSALTPHGLDPTPAEKERYAALVAAGAFGRDPSLRCPHHLPGGACAIWRHRNAICATWYCRHERGAAGERFWQALQRALTAIELELCHHVACQLLDPADAPPAPADGGDPDELPEWAAWRGREAEYYRRAWARVAAMSTDEILAIAAAGAAQAIADLHAAQAALADDAPPARLLPGTYELVERRGADARLVGYSEIDAIIAPAALLDRLARFDGRPTPAVVADLAADGVTVDDALLRRLVDFGVLVE